MYDKNTHISTTGEEKVYSKICYFDVPTKSIDWLIDWCLTPTLVVFQLYSGVHKLYIILTKTPTRSLEIKHTCL
jgi:hypothetical protein